MIGHFLPKHKPWLKDGHTRAMYRGVWEVHSRTNYILGIDSHLLQNIAVRDESHNTDHYLVLGCLCGAKPAAHSRYLGNRTRFPISPLATPDKADHMFAEIWQANPRPPWR